MNTKRITTEIAQAAEQESARQRKQAEAVFQRVLFHCVSFPV